MRASKIILHDTNGCDDCHATRQKAFRANIWEATGYPLHIENIKACKQISDAIKKVNRFHSLFFSKYIHNFTSRCDLGFSNNKEQVYIYSRKRLSFFGWQCKNIPEETPKKDWVIYSLRTTNSANH